MSCIENRDYNEFINNKVASFQVTDSLMFPLQIQFRNVVGLAQATIIKPTSYNQVNRLAI